MSITILNNTGHDIQVKITSDGIGSPDWFLIGRSDYWTRKPGNYTLSVILKENSEPISYQVTAPSILSFSSYGELTNDQTGMILYPTYVNFSSYKVPSNQSNDIIICNKSGADIHVRISTKDTGSQDFFVIKRGASDVWKRTPGFNYFMQFGYFPYEENCTVAYVRTGEIYNIFSNTSLKLDNGNPVELFQGLFIYGYADKTDNDEIDINFKFSGITINDPSKINIYNKSQNFIKVRVKSKGSGSEEFYQISFNGMDSWSRSSGSFLTEIVTHDGKSHRFYLSCGTYFFMNNYLTDNYNNSIQATSDSFLGYSTNNSIDFTIDDNKQHFRNFFDPNKITIFNQTVKPLRVRIKTNGSGGSEDLFTIATNCHDAWSRGTEYYLTEVNYSTISFRFYLKRGFYYFSQEKMYDSDGNVIANTIDSFTTNIKPQNNQGDYSNTNKISGKIIISNKYGKVILVKISVHDIGCANWYKIQSNETDSWTRENKEFEMSISFDGNEQSFSKYMVTAPISLVIEHDKTVRDSGSGLVLKPNDSSKDIITDNLDIPKNLPENPYGITVINYTSATIFVRISCVGDGSEDFFEIKSGFSDSWNRKNPKTYYQMQYSLNNSNPNGPIVFVKAGNYYIITQNYLVTYVDGTAVPVSYDKFKSFNNNNNNISPTPNPDVPKNDSVPSDKKIYNNTKDKIFVYNESDKEIRVRIKSTGSGSEDLFPIPTNNYDHWSRLAGTYLSEIVTHDGNNYRFYLISSKTYSFLSNHKLIETSSNSEINLTTDSFDQKKVVVEKNNKIWIENLSKEKISIRIKTKGTGSEDYFDIQGGTKDSWTRDEGTYLMELKISSGKCNSYYIKSSSKYNYLGEDQLVDNETKKEVPQTQDKFQVENNLGNLSYFENKQPSFVSGTPFVDNHFPPKVRIINSLDENGYKKKPHFKSYSESDLDTSGLVFKRATEIFKSNFYLFKDKIEVDDVTQGGVGDCWLIGAIAALCNRPELIQNIFKTKSANKEGYYEIYYYENGVKKIMFVDDYFSGVSYYGGDFRFKFAKPNGEELWVVLLEKAFAKFEGGYSNINGGLINNAFTFFTGGVSKYIHNLSSSWEEIYSAVQRGNILAAGSKSGRDTDFSYNNIAQGHAYSILDAREYNDYSKRVKLIKLRNPWGEKEWTGDYSDKSYLWTPALIEFFGAKEAFGENGIFFMKYEDFYKEFSYVVVCCV